MAEIGAGPARTAFQEAAAAATEQAAAEQFGVVADEQAAETPVVEEVAATETVAPPADETPAETLLAGKYKTQEDLERGYLEQKAVLDRQGSELGELRRAFDQRFQEINERLDTPTPQYQQITPDLIDRDPAQATQLAYSQKDTGATNIAYQQWLAEDAGAAASWFAATLSAEQAKELRAEMSAREQALEARFAPIAQQQDQAALTSGIAALSPEVRTFLSDAETVQALAAEFPTIGTTIANGTVSERLNAINALHGIHRGRTADTLNQAVTDVARTTAQEAQAVRDEAYVASSTASESETLTWEQQEQQRMTEYATRRAVPFGGGLVIPGK